MSNINPNEINAVFYNKVNQAKGKFYNSKSISVRKECISEIAAAINYLKGMLSYIIRFTEFPELFILTV